MGGACAVRRIAIVGGGFAGCAVAWHLLAAARPGAPIAVALFDGAGLGGGASGAAAGLLHPFTPRGRVRRRPRQGGQACSCCWVGRGVQARSCSGSSCLWAGLVALCVLGGPQV